MFEDETEEKKEWAFKEVKNKIQYEEEGRGEMER